MTTGDRFNTDIDMQCFCDGNLMITLKSQGWGIRNHFPSFRFFLIFHHCEIISYLLNITSIFDKCHRSSAALTPVKYKSDSKNLTGIFFAKWKMLNGEINEWGFSNTPTPGRVKIIPWIINIVRTLLCLAGVWYWLIQPMYMVYSGLVKQPRGVLVNEFINPLRKMI